ncbi:MAG: hypothetical protein GY941_19880 [Planctomycetes bacterium]|nr:hypothetical protein [Planctomycetota bacterium]
MDYVSDPRVRLTAVVLGALFYTTFQYLQSKKLEAPHTWFNLTVNFFSSVFTGGILGIGAVGISSEAGVSLALYGAGALIGPAGFEKLLLAVSKK